MRGEGKGLKGRLEFGQEEKQTPWYSYLTLLCFSKKAPRTAPQRIPGVLFCFKCRFQTTIQQQVNRKLAAAVGPRYLHSEQILCSQLTACLDRLGGCGYHEISLPRKLFLKRQAARFVWELWENSRQEVLGMEGRVWVWEEGAGGS